jgi:hypothetical protein
MAYFNRGKVKENMGDRDGGFLKLESTDFC